MKPEVRDALGKAAFMATVARQAELSELEADWEGTPEDNREYYRVEAEAVVKELAAMLLPIVLHTLLSGDQIKGLLQNL